eukprot:GHVH01005505.1.p1 GENE.GHVH01005505.1~~GHVH01005505.1.p1  ORF type:complete len:548 (+),score=50.45 GHVH01005505.1:51-1694(+)
MAWVLPTVIAPLLLFATIGIGAVFWTNGRSFRGLAVTNASKITAEGRIRWTQIMASAWIHGTGAWVLFAPTETGWTAGVWGVVAYSIGCGLPGFAFSILGPTVASMTCGFSLVDWVRTRFSVTVYYMLLILSCFFLFIVSSSELTGLLDAFDFLINSSETDFDVTSPSFTWIPALVVLVANTYACVGGLEVSLITDRVEGLFCLIFLGMCLWVTTSLSQQMVEPVSWEITPEGRNALVTLILGCWINEMINQTQWQRVFSAKSPNHLRSGATLGSILIMIQIATFGMSGVIVHALYQEGKMPPSFDPSMDGTDSFFWGLYMANDSSVLIEITLGITCCIVCSTTDTLVNAYSSLMIKPMERKNIPLKWAPLITLLFTLPAIGVATARLSVVSLFMTINVIAVSVIPGIFLGLFHYGSSTFAVITTSTLGILSVPIYGGVLEGTFSGAFEQFLFPRGSYDTNSAVIFLICTSISLFGTPLVALIHRKVDPIGFELEWTRYQELVSAMQADKLKSPSCSSASEEDYYYGSRVTSSRLGFCVEDGYSREE